MAVERGDTASINASTSAAKAASMNAREAGDQAAIVGHFVPYSHRLLDLARKLIDAGEDSIAIIVSHIACEVATDRAFADAFKAKGLEYLEEPVGKLLASNNLGHDKARKLYTALTGDDVGNQPFWARFKDSVTRRNRVSHNSAIYKQPDAEASLAVAKEFVARLGK